MATLTKTKRTIPFSFYPLALVTLVGVGLSIYRLAVGLGPTTNLNDHSPGDCGSRWTCSSSR